MLVQLVVRQFDFLEGNHLLHQLLSGERWVRVDVQPAREEEEIKSSVVIGWESFKRMFDTQSTQSCDQR